MITTPTPGLPVIGWQERQQKTATEWSNWYPVKTDRSLHEPLELDYYQWRPLADHAQATARIAELEAIIGAQHTQLVAANQRAEAAEADRDELRRIWCYNVCGASAYMDDGEAQDSSALPFIDFLRDPIHSIREKLLARARTGIDAAMAAGTEGGAHADQA